MEYEVVIGLEVHAQLLTRSKMFCGCSAAYADTEPNSHVCPVCLGMPGSLPVINRRAVEYTIMAGLALNCQVPEFTKWDRKNYHYPDLPKGYQISQYDLPLTKDGRLEVESEGREKRIGIRRVHLEEDTAKLFHMGEHSLIDFNRAGVPLLEIVSEPDMRSTDGVRQYVVKLRNILRYLGINSGDMEKGAMRFEANISLRRAGASEYGTRVEIKNLNSFRAVLKSLEYEADRQRKVLDRGGTIIQETMGWDEEREVTVLQRGKEHAHDYRYFPEPDLPPLVISREWVEQIKANVPELPDLKLHRFVTQYGLTVYDAGLLTEERAMADYFEESARLYPDAKAVANWITRTVFPHMNETGQSVEEVRAKFPPNHIEEVLRMVGSNEITVSTATTVTHRILVEGKGSPRGMVRAEGLAQIADVAELEGIVNKVVEANAQAVADYRAGKEQAIEYLIGQVMKATKGKANPKLASQVLEKRLKES